MEEYARLLVTKQTETVRVFIIIIIIIIITLPYMQNLQS